MKTKFTSNIMRWVTIATAILITTMLLPLGSFPEVGAQNLAGKKVTLDPGHGWLSASGASANGMNEKDITLDIANLLKPILEGQGIQVSMTRTGDEPSLGLEYAAIRANQFQADVVVSIHANAGGGTGTESCYTVGKSTSNESIRLATLLTQKVSTLLDLDLRGNFPEHHPTRCDRYETTGWTQLYIHRMDPPTAIIETAFIDGPLDNDVAKLRDRRVDFAQAIAQAILEYLSGPPSPNVDVVLIIDSSGSMTWNDPGNKRLEAARAYLTASLEDDFVGVVDFDNNVRLASPLLRLPDNKTSLINAINTINSSGGTNIGIGVQEGCDALVASPSGNTKAAILLTNGQGSFAGQDACFNSRGWPIYTFGLGSADDVLLQRIASNTGGEYKRLPTSDLVCEFQRVRSKIAGIEPGPCTAIRVDPFVTTIYLASVPPGQGQATFSTSWTGSDVVMTLTSPTGRVIDRNTVAPDVTHDLGPTFEVYTIVNPELGDWEVSLFGADVPPEGEDVIFGITTVPAPNQPPTADPNGPYAADEGGEIIFDGTGSFDPDGDALDFIWDFGDGTTGSGPSVSRVYAENGDYIVTLTVTDPAGLSDTQTTVAAVANVPPTVEAGPDHMINEGDSISLVPATFTDPGVLDTHTATIDWGDGTVDTGVVSESDGSGTVSGSHVYGDNGTFVVTVTVCDDDGGCGEDSFTVTVNNVPPSVTLDISSAVSFAGGDAFLGRKEVEQIHQASATDPGSDDLTFRWNFGATTTYFNDGVGPDPFPSPGGAFPFEAADTASVTFDAPGVHTVAVEVADDDGGIDSASLPKLVTDDHECTRTQGFWKHQFSEKGKHQIDDATLQAYLDIVNFASAVFSEQVPTGTIEEAREVMKVSGSSMRDNAEAQLLAAWLNFAQGAVGWDELIDTNDDDVGDIPFHQVMSEAEAILLNADATHDELEHAKDLAEAVNLHDEDNLACSEG